MYYTANYASPIGPLTLASDGASLVGLWLEGQKYFGGGLGEAMLPQEELPVFTAVRDWLDRYFAGERPSVSQLPLSPMGSPFRQEVWKLLRGIPYGEVMTYGAIARQLADHLGRESVSAQAVGGAVGHNPISIIIPCHRVIGSDGSLTGYAGGFDKKAWLLRHEGAELALPY